MQSFFNNPFTSHFVTLRTLPFLLRRTTCSTKFPEGIPPFKPNLFIFVFLFNLNCIGYSLVSTMVGAFSLVGSPVIDSSPHSCAFLCLDNALMSGKSMGKKQSRQVGSLELSSSFVDHGKEVLLGVVNGRTFVKQRRIKRPFVVSELGGQYDDNFTDVKTQLLNYFTYKAVRTVLNQLYEMNPPDYTWLYHFVVANKPGEGKIFIRKLGKERRDLAERVMVTRLHLYGKWIKKCDHAEIYQEISEENLGLMRERLLETVVWPNDDTNTQK